MKTIRVLAEQYPHGGPPFAGLMEKQMEQPINHTERSLGGAIRDYVREVLAGESPPPNPNAAEQRWEDEGGSSL